mgnify:CR=1 FL=1
MDRFGPLSRLQSNWPGKYSMDRQSFMERELRDFEVDILGEAVTEVLRTCEWPPTVRHLHSACSRISARKETNKEGRTFFPGDVVDGEKTLTPSEAKIELERMRKEYPEAFNYTAYSASGSDHASSSSIEIVVTSIYIGALRRCIKLDPGVPVELSEFVQDDLF